MSDELTGEALRVAVAERVFGRTVEPLDFGNETIGTRIEPGWWDEGIPRRVKPYESDISAAFEMVERMREDGRWRLTLRQFLAHQWQADFDRIDDRDEFVEVEASGKTPAEAIARAALTAVESADADA